MTSNRISYAFNIILARALNLSGIFFIAVIFFCSCRNKTEDINALTGKGVSVQEDKAQDVTIYYSEKGQMKAVLHAVEFIRNEVARPPYIDVKKGLKIDFYKDSTVESTLTARYARMYEREQNVLIRDSILIINNKGEKLNTEELVWNQQANKFFTEKPVRISTPTQVMYGDGLEANQDFSWYQIKNLKGIVEVNKSELPQ